jgi:hypothetical protein
VDLVVVVLAKQVKVLMEIQVALVVMEADFHLHS